MNSATHNFRVELEDQLKEAGLPSDPKQVVSRIYRFTCEHGSHHHLLVGTILAIEISDEGGLDLYVTNPKVWGDPLIKLKRDQGKWFVWQNIEEMTTPFEGFLSGELELL